MKKLKLFALIAVVLVISMISVSAAWAGPAAQTVPEGTETRGEVVLLPPVPGMVIVDPPMGFTALSYAFIVGMNVESSGDVCIPVPDGSYSVVEIRYQAPGYDGTFTWFPLPTTLSGYTLSPAGRFIFSDGLGWACAQVYGTTYLIQLMGW